MPMRSSSDAYRYWRRAKFPGAISSEVLYDIKGDLALRNFEIADIAIALVERRRFWVHLREPTKPRIVYVLAHRPS